jgi:hypothetical protein
MLRVPTSGKQVNGAGWGGTELLNLIGGIKDYKGGYRLVSKIKDEGFEADLYIKHCCTCTLCTVRHMAGFLVVV